MLRGAARRLRGVRVRVRCSAFRGAARWREYANLRRCAEKLRDASRVIFSNPPLSATFVNPNLIDV